MDQQDLLPHLFRTEYRKIISVLTKLFGIEYIKIAEDIVSDTFLQAAETWGLKGLPENPTAWLYSVSKNKALDVIKHNKVFTDKVSVQLRKEESTSKEIEIDLSAKNINDSQLEMMFAICHSSIPVESQIGLSLNILCGFGADEIADAFLTNKDVIYKRLQRAKAQLKEEKIEIKLPPNEEINNRLETVLTTLYLLFSEGYYSSSQNTQLRKDLCVEAMRLNKLLVDNESTNTPQTNALLALMCFHSSRFEARTNSNGEIVLYEDQDENLWNKELIQQGEFYMNRAAQGNQLSKYHAEAAIAYWHTQKKDTGEKWANILRLYNQLLVIEYSPMAALNRTYALAKANGKEEAIKEAEKLNFATHHLYHSLLGNLYTGVDNVKALKHYQQALNLARTEADKKLIEKNIVALES